MAGRIVARVDPRNSTVAEIIEEKENLEEELACQRFADVFRYYEFESATSSRLGADLGQATCTADACSAYAASAHCGRNECGMRDS